MLVVFACVYVVLVAVEVWLRSPASALCLCVLSLGIALSNLDWWRYIYFVCAFFYAWDAILFSYERRSR